MCGNGNGVITVVKDREAEHRKDKLDWILALAKSGTKIEELEREIERLWRVLEEVAQYGPASEEELELIRNRELLDIECLLGVDVATRMRGAIKESNA